MSCGSWVFCVLGAFCWSSVFCFDVPWSEVFSQFLETFTVYFAGGVSCKISLRTDLAATSVVRYDVIWSSSCLCSCCLIAIILGNVFLLSFRTRLLILSLDLRSMYLIS